MHTRIGDLTLQGFFCFLAICTIGAVAGFQAKWFSVCKSQHMHSGTLGGSLIVFSGRDGICAVLEHPGFHLDRPFDCYPDSI